MKKRSIFLSILTAFTITISSVMLPVCAADAIDDTTTSTESSTTSEEKSQSSTQSADSSSVDSDGTVSSETSETKKTDSTKPKTILKSIPKAIVESGSDEETSDNSMDFSTFADEFDISASADMEALMQIILSSFYEDEEISEEDVIKSIKELSNMTLKDFMLMDEELQAPLKENRPADESLVWLSEYSNIALSAEKVEGTMPKSGWVSTGTVLDLPKVYERNMAYEFVEMDWCASVFPRADLDQNICDLLGVEKIGDNPTETQLGAFFMRFMTEFFIYMIDHTVDITNPSYTVPEGSLVLLDGLDPEEYYDEPEQFFLTLDANGGVIKNPDEIIWNYIDEQEFPHILYFEPTYDEEYDYDQTDFEKVTLYLMCKFGFEKEVADLVTPTRKNYTFKGWSTQKLDAYDKGKTDSSKLISYPLEEKEDMADITLYAVWERTETSSNPKTSDSLPYVAFLFLCISGMSLPLMRKKIK